MADEKEMDVLGDQEVQEVQEETWVTDDIVEEGKTYGLNKKDLQEFSDADEFRRAGRLLDMQAVRLAAPSTPEETAKGEEEEWKPPIDIDQLRENDYDDNSIAMGEEINKTSKKNWELEKSLKKEQEKAGEEALMQRFTSFHEALDEYDPEFFGVTKDQNGNVNELSLTEDDRRAKVFGNLDMLAASHPPNAPFTKAMVSRAVRLSFDRDPAKKEAAKEQSRKRRTVGRSSDSNKPAAVGTPEEVADRPEVKALWRKFARENGDL